jgi:formate dehydrogenase maturation protein FdhE
MRSPAVATGHWAERRRRAGDLAKRWPFATEVLTFYGALLDAQERVYEAAQSLPQAQLSDSSRVASYVAERALPLVREVTVARGPEKLARAVADLGRGGNDPAGRWAEKVRRWLGEGELSPVDRYLVRAAAGPVLEALGAYGVSQDVQAAAGVGAGPRDERHCPRCGGLPQVSLFAPTEESLVAPRRYLECSRCAYRWAFPRMTCPACGETESRRLPIHAEEGATASEAAGTVVRGVEGAGRAATPGPGPRLPHVSVHACSTCSRYLLNVDLSREGRAVPVVDEMAAIPLDLYAREHGVAKIVPNLMGF